ncbi:MAG: LacI family DNA-binding transcriptional regulator, partial [Sphaerochaetaceae bacterium]|nr:LacI family DNA-binding transcriptional regulator [Sphaerochaetaceae bacterium]
KSTKQKISKLLEQYNFIPNSTARSLATKATKMVGVLVSDIRETYHTYAVYYVEKELSKRGYSCLIYNTGADAFYQTGANPDKMLSSIEMLSQRDIEAVIMIGSLYQHNVVLNAINKYFSKIPVMMIGSYLEGENIYCVLSDDFLGLSDAVKYLAGKGHKNIAFIYNHLTPSVKTKLEGFENGFNKYVEGGNKYIVWGTTDIETMANKTKEVLNEHPEITAIVFSDDYQAMIGLHSISELGKKVPNDVAVVGVNNSRYTEFSIPTLTSVDTMLSGTSVSCIRNLFAIIDGEDVPKRMYITPQIVERKST